MNTTAQKYFIYARKSTESEDRQARSIADQLAELREVAERNHFEIVDVLTESQSAKKPGRPVFNDMLARLEKGQADGIMAWHPDRLSRNPLDAGRLMWLLDTGTIPDLKFANYTFESTSAGKLMLAIAFGMSKYYIDRLSEDIRRGMRQKIKNGIWPQRAPIGYLNDRATRGIIPDPVKAPLIRKAFELYDTGNYTLAELRNKMNALGLVAWTGALSTSNYQYLLKNPIYTGLMRHKGELYEGKHQPIISKALFDKCQAVMLERRKPKPSKLKPYLFRGIFHCCECGCLVTTETQKGHDYLHCTKRKVRCSQPYVRAEAVQGQIDEAIAAYSLPDTVADWMLVEIDAERATDSTEHQESLKTTRGKIAGVTAKLDRLMAAYLDQTLSLDEYKVAKSKLIEEKKLLEEEAIAVERNRLSWFEPAKRFILAAKNSTLLLSEGNPTQKLNFIRKAGSNLILGNKRVGWEPRGAWKLVVNAGRLAPNTNAASCDAALVSGEPDQHRLKRRE